MLDFKKGQDSDALSYTLNLSNHTPKPRVLFSKLILLEIFGSGFTKRASAKVRKPRCFIANTHSRCMHSTTNSVFLEYRKCTVSENEIGGTVCAFILIFIFLGVDTRILIRGDGR